MCSKKTGTTAYKNTFKSKNTYENILTGINKEERNKNQISEQEELFLKPTTPQPHGINKIEDYRLKESIKKGRVFSGSALKEETKNQT